MKVEVETIYDISSGFCYLMARNLHLTMKKITFVDGLSNFDFIPDENYSPVTQITCVGLDRNGQRYETQTLIEYEQLPNNVNR